MDPVKTRPVRSADATAVAAPPSVEVCRAQLAKILDSPEFHASPRCQSFLRFVVEKALDGRVSDLKERVIGFEVFGRPSDYEPSTDATVRVKAGEVRKRLANYYLGLGAKAPVRIDLPLGGYIPTFAWNERAEPELDVPAVPARRRRPLPVLLGLLVVLAALGLAGYHWYGIRENRTLRAFWGAALESRAPVLFCVSYVPVYRLNDDTGAGTKRPVELRDFIPVNEHFVGGGDMLGVAKIEKTMDLLGKDSRVGVGDQISFNDIKSGPSVLVGYSYTHWQQLGQGVRFSNDTDASYFGIRDGKKATPWRLQPAPPDRRTKEDYAVITRIFHPDTGNMVVVAAGLTQYGTEAACELISNEDLLANALRPLPPGWERKNLQIVLHATVISGEAGTPRVLAFHSW